MMKTIKCRAFSLLMLGLFLTLITGCGTLENGRGWGQDALYPVNGKRVSKALYNAGTDWGTLIPAGGAVVSSLGNFDERVNSWATGHNPIFGSMDSASRAANYLVGILQAEVVVTALATPSGEDSKEWVSSKAKGLSVELGAELVTAGVTNGLKNISNRERPGGRDKQLPVRPFLSSLYQCRSCQQESAVHLDVRQSQICTGGRERTPCLCNGLGKS